MLRPHYRSDPEMGRVSRFQEEDALSHHCDASGPCPANPVRQAFLCESQYNHHFDGANARRSGLCVMNQDSIPAVVRLDHLAASSVHLDRSIEMGSH